ncbi:uncharacterized protein lmtk3 [Polypterus senegalus]|uniref:uncharacterized protein lmtk3 n=1 Tax=Polypterus senegalus TaxID=55291 RepID=UPI0019649027|nr:uncharacterized protein lmtk3 [Polypterus senegalus]
MVRRSCLWVPYTVVIMSYFNPERALAAPQDNDGVVQSRASPLAPPPYVVVLISGSGLFSFVLLLLACLCCKRGAVGFNEFDNPDGDEFSGDYSPPAEDSSSSQSIPEVYILPLSDVSNAAALHSNAVGGPHGFSRHSLSYLQEIGNGWFGKVILAEIFSDSSPAQAVVKELRVSASPLEQRKFLTEAQPYRSLRHPNILQCLGLCSDTIPLLLVMEFCQLGDLKRYLRAQRKSDGMTPDLLTRDLATLQRMAFEITSGLLHLHQNNYIHSDLALRNCLLTSDLTVRIGDYGLSHNHYKDDYYLTPDKLWIPLRWIAPEILDEFHGNVVVTDQSKESNVWSLGVTIWELFEFGAQPHRHLSDEEVLTFVIKERQIKLAKPRLKLLHSDYWYEVMQSCWLPPAQRPTVDEIHLLLSSLLAAERGMGAETDDTFEQRWDTLKPPPLHHFFSTPEEIQGPHAHYISKTSFPLLEQVSSSSGPITTVTVDLDDILTVTETSRGLNFEYLWEQARRGRGQATRARPATHPIPITGSTPHTQANLLSRTHNRHSLDTPTVVPVISARSPSLASEYYIRLEEHAPNPNSPPPNQNSLVPTLAGEKGHMSSDLQLQHFQSQISPHKNSRFCISSPPKGRCTLTYSPPLMGLSQTHKYRHQSDFTGKMLPSVNNEQKRSVGNASSDLELTEIKPRSNDLEFDHMRLSKTIPSKNRENAELRQVKVMARHNNIIMTRGPELITTGQVFSEQIVRSTEAAEILSLEPKIMPMDISMPRECALSSTRMSDCGLVEITVPNHLQSYASPVKSGRGLKERCELGNAQQKTGCYSHQAQLAVELDHSLPALIPKPTCDNIKMTSASYLRSRPLPAPPRCASFTSESAELTTFDRVYGRRLSLEESESMDCLMRNVKNQSMLSSSLDKSCGLRDVRNHQAVSTFRSGGCQSSIHEFTDPLMGTAIGSFDPLGFQRQRRPVVAPPSPSLSPSIPPSSSMSHSSMPLTLSARPLPAPFSPSLPPPQSSPPPLPVAYQLEEQLPSPGFAEGLTTEREHMEAASNQKTSSHGLYQHSQSYQESQSDNCSSQNILHKITSINVTENIWSENVKDSNIKENKLGESETSEMTPWVPMVENQMQKESAQSKDISVTQKDFVKQAETTSSQEPLTDSVMNSVDESHSAAIKLGESEPTAEGSLFTPGATNTCRVNQSAHTDSSISVSPLASVADVEPGSSSSLKLLPLCHGVEVQVKDKDSSSVEEETTNYIEITSNSPLSTETSNLYTVEVMASTPPHTTLADNPQLSETTTGLPISSEKIDISDDLASNCSPLPEIITPTQSSTEVTSKSPLPAVSESPSPSLKFKNLPIIEIIPCSPLSTKTLSRSTSLIDTYSSKLPSLEVSSSGQCAFEPISRISHYDLVDPSAMPSSKTNHNISLSAETIPIRSQSPETTSINKSSQENQPSLPSSTKMRSSDPKKGSPYSRSFSVDTTHTNNWPSHKPSADFVSRNATPEDATLANITLPWSVTSTAISTSQSSVNEIHIIGTLPQEVHVFASGRTVMMNNGSDTEDTASPHMLSYSSCCLTIPEDSMQSEGVLSSPSLAEINNPESTTLDITLSDQSSSAFTPTDGTFSPLSSTLDCMTPADPVEGTGEFRMLGSDTPHRDSAYFSDGESDLERGRRGTTPNRICSAEDMEELQGKKQQQRLEGIPEKLENEGSLFSFNDKEVNQEGSNQVLRVDSLILSEDVGGILENRIGKNFGKGQGEHFDNAALDEMREGMEFDKDKLRIHNKSTEVQEIQEYSREKEVQNQNCKDTERQNNQNISKANPQLIALQASDVLQMPKEVRCENTGNLTEQQDINTQCYANLESDILRTQLPKEGVLGADLEKFNKRNCEKSPTEVQSTCQKSPQIYQYISENDCQGSCIFKSYSDTGLFEQTDLLDSSSSLSSIHSFSMAEEERTLLKNLSDLDSLKKLDLQQQLGNYSMSDVEFLADNFEIQDLEQNSIWSDPESQHRDPEQDSLENFEKLEMICLEQNSLENYENAMFTDSQGFAEDIFKKVDMSEDRTMEIIRMQQQSLEKLKNSDLIDSTFYSFQNFESSDLHRGVISCTQANANISGRQANQSNMLTPRITEETISQISQGVSSREQSVGKKRDQRSLSKKQAENGLMVQVCEERLQFSLRENVNHNVLSSGCITEKVHLQPWHKSIAAGLPETENQDKKPGSPKGLVDASANVTEIVGQNSNHEHCEKDTSSNDADIHKKSWTNEFSHQPELLAGPETGESQSVSTSAQSIKAKLARLSLALPPLAFDFTLTPIPSRDRGQEMGYRGSIGDQGEEEEDDEDEGEEPVIVVTETETERRLSLRSLLKSPRSLEEQMEKESEREKRRNVSFFDDVTVYLFDQETPTNELSSGSAPTSPPSSLDATTSSPSPEERLEEKTNVEMKEDSPVKKESESTALTSSRFTVSPAQDPPSPSRKSDSTLED